MAVATPTDRPKSVRNRCLIGLFVALFVLSLCPFDIFVGEGTFVIGLSQISCFLSLFRKFYGRYGDLIQQYEVSLSRMLNDILTLAQQWLPNQSDFPPISWPWYRLWPSPNYEWFPWSICNGCGMPAGNAYPSGHLVPSPQFRTC